MTRDEVIAKVRADDNDRFSRDRWLIESLVKLGLLKLDESLEERALAVIRGCVDDSYATSIMEGLAYEGLKFVEK